MQPSKNPYLTRVFSSHDLRRIPWPAHAHMKFGFILCFSKEPFPTLASEPNQELFLRSGFWSENNSWFTQSFIANRMLCGAIYHFDLVRRRSGSYPGRKTGYILSA